MKTMKILKVITAGIFFSSAWFINNTYAQTPAILIDGVPAMANISASPFWLHAGQTLAAGNKVKSISILEYNVVPAIGGGKSLQFDSIISVTTQQTVLANKAWKIESVALDTSASQGIQGPTGPQGAAGATGPIGCTNANYLLKYNGSNAACSQIFDNGNNVGIGTTNPSALLDLGLAGTTLGVIRLAGSSSGNVSLQPNADAGLGIVLTLPATTGTLVTGGGTASGTNTGDQINISGNAATVTTNANLTGDITSVGNATTIAAKAVTLAKMNDMATASLLGRNTAGTGVPEVLSAATARSILNVADGATNYTHPTGDGNLHVPATSTTNNGKILTAGATAGSLSWTAGTTYLLTPSSTLQLSADATASVTETSYTKKKEIVVWTGGKIKVSYDIWGSTNSGTMGRTYVNGVAVGTENSNAQNQPVKTCTDNSITVQPGDAVQVYIYRTGDCGASWCRMSYVNNFRIYYDVEGHVPGTGIVVIN
ncbi:MAG: hypothetical protein HGB12_01735 [Bacteroidetes bacterium]|nr:hypothetical protein [Bacteroidota bacterium]